MLNIFEVEVNDESIIPKLDDGGTITIPITWYPCLQYGTVSKRNNYKLIGNGQGIHWGELDEDISAAGLLSGHRSNESQESLKKWLDGRKG